MYRYWRRLVPALFGLGLLSLPAPGPAAVTIGNKPIQPGAPVIIPDQIEPDPVTGEGADALCTLNFVFRDSLYRKYIGTAGHCADKKDVVLDYDGRRIGVVVFKEDQLVESADGLRLRDFALIRVDKGRYADVSPAVRDWGGPTGTASSSTTQAGDVLVFSGNGEEVLGFFSQTRARPGILVEDSSTTYRADMPAVPGDSGSPVLHEETGKALGIVSSIIVPDFPQTTDIGPTLPYIMARLKAAGWNVRLVTAQYGGGLPV